MKAFDTDILTEILVGNLAYAERLATVPLEEQAAPVVAIEESCAGVSMSFVKQKLPRRASPLTRRIACSRKLSRQFGS
jgi:hypothetical protein